MVIASKPIKIIFSMTDLTFTKSKTIIILLISLGQLIQYNPQHKRIRLNNNIRHNIILSPPMINRTLPKPNTIGEDVIAMYQAYKDPVTKWKKNVIGNIIFELPQYYKPLTLIGSGAYGAVATAFDNRLPQDKREENIVAIKKMTNAFEHKIYARRVLRELKLLRLLSHPNIIEVKTIILPKSREQFEDIYVVFEAMDSDLFSVIKKGDEDLQQTHFQYFLYQILRGLMYMHSANVIHRDIKTRNLLINADCNVKICDFGLARIMTKSKAEGLMTDYVATRWYRAPQLLLGQTNYTPAVDIWSVGCIFAELITKKPFLPATSTKEQLELICDLVEPEDLATMKKQNSEHFFTISKIMDKKKKKKINLIDQKIKNVSAQTIQLLKKMLAVDPKNRITAAQALNHPYFKQFREPDDELVREPVHPLQFQFDNYNLTTQQFKDLIYEQILMYHFPAFAKSYKAKLQANQSVIVQILNNSNSKNINPATDADDDNDDD